MPACPGPAAAPGAGRRARRRPRRGSGASRFVPGAARQARPAVPPSRRPRRASPARSRRVAPHEQLDPGLLGQPAGRRAEPVVGRRVEVGAATLPGPGGRHADEVELRADGARAFLAEQLLELLAVKRAAVECAPQLAGGGRELPSRHPVRRDPHGPFGPGALDADLERPVVGARDEMDRGSHQRRLHDAAPLERSGEAVALEAFEPRPEADVHDGAYCACSPAMRSSARGIGARVRSSSSCLASSARFSSRAVRTRSAAGTPPSYTASRAPSRTSSSRLRSSPPP